MDARKTYGYCRVSTLEQKKKGFGLDIQVREIKKFAKDYGITVNHIFKDEAVSGMEENREDLGKLLNLCRNNEVKAVIFPSTDRTARSVRIAENLYNELGKYDVRIYLIDMPNYDPENHDDVFIRQIKEAVAERERKDIVKKLKKGRQERIRKGQPPGGNVPYGYRRRGKKLIPIPLEMGVVRLIFDLAQNDEKPFKIAQILNEQGLKRRNKKEWTGQRVAGTLQRKELYQEGIIHYGEVKGQNKKLIILDDD